MSGFEAFQQCAWCGVLNGSERLEFTYDRIELEHSHQNRLRADIALFSGGELTCAIEIYVSHRCGYEKIAYHDEAGIPCLEVSAEYAQKWILPKPLSPTAVHGIDKWICSTCRERAKSVPALGTLGHPAPPVEFEPPPPQPREESGKVKRKIIALQKIFFTEPPDDLPFEQTFLTVEYAEDERGGQVQFKRLFVWDSGKIIRTLYEACPPYDEQKDAGFKKAYKEFVEELIASYGPVRKGRWMTFPKNAGMPPGRKTPTAP